MVQNGLKLTEQFNNMKAAAREYIKHLPHVKKVWVKDGKFYIHNTPGSTLIDLSEPEVEQKPIKVKKQKDGTE